MEIINQKSTYILGDSIVKKLVKVHSFSGAKINYMSKYVRFPEQKLTV